MTAGSYTGTITFSSFGALNSPQTLTVNLSEAPPPPSLVTAPATLTFSGAQGGNSPAAQTLSIRMEAQANSTGRRRVTHRGLPSRARPEQLLCHSKSTLVWEPSLLLIFGQYYDNGAGCCWITNKRPRKSGHWRSLMSDDFQFGSAQRLG